MKEVSLSYGSPLWMKILFWRGEGGRGERRAGEWVAVMVEHGWTDSEEEREASAVAAHHEVLGLHTQLTNYLLEKFCLMLLGNDIHVHVHVADISLCQLTRVAASSEYFISASYTVHSSLHKGIPYSQACPLSNRSIT